MRSSNGIWVLVAIILTVAVTGYFVGMRESRQSSIAPRLLPPATNRVETNASNNAVPALKYAELPWRKFGPNRDWSVDLTKLVQPTSPDPPKMPPSAIEREQAVTQRHDRRAFDGAPPVIPHPIAPLGTSVCMACHENGLVVGKKVATKMSHPLYANCTQCHVEAEPGGLSDIMAFKALTERAFAGAPAPMPHPVWMRENCLSCHGPTGQAGLRTTHPERINCLQCHAATAMQDALPRITSTTGNLP